MGLLYTELFLKQNLRVGKELKGLDGMHYIGKTSIIWFSEYYWEELPNTEPGVAPNIA